MGAREQEIRALTEVGGQVDALAQAAFAASQTPECEGCNEAEGIEVPGGAMGREQKNLSVKRVLIVEDDPATLESVVRRVSADDVFAVVGTADTVSRGTDLLRTCQPDILVTDIGLPDGTGLDLISLASAMRPPPAILVLTVFGDEAKAIAAIERGAHGYLLKDEPVMTLQSCLWQLVEGGSPISPPIARHLIRKLKSPSAGPVSVEADAVRLTDREREVLSLAAKGYSHAEIGRLLEISPTTVASYTRKVYEKLAVHSRAEAVFEAARLGLLSAGDSQ